MDINEIIRQVTEEICSKYGANVSAPAAAGNNAADMAKYIDHTYLKPEATLTDIRKICDEAKKYHTASVCVNPSYIQYVAQQLEGSGVTPCCVIAFPLGACTPETKAFEASDAATKGAKEIDMVINIGAVKSGDWMLVKRDIEGVVNAVKGRAQVKVIIECCLLTDAEKVRLCQIVSRCGADYIKTSTGFSKGGATREDVKLMRENCPESVKVKAAGGISSLQDAEEFIALGAERLGTSRVVKAAMELENAEGAPQENY